MFVEHDRKQTKQLFTFTLYFSLHLTHIHIQAGIHMTQPTQVRHA